MKKEFLISVVTKLFDGISSTTDSIDDDFIKRILKDIDVSSALQKLERAVSGRKVLIVSKTDGIQSLKKKYKIDSQELSLTEL